MTKEILRCPYVFPGDYPPDTKLNPNCDCIDCKSWRRKYGFSPADATLAENFNINGCMD